MTSTSVSPFCAVIKSHSGDFLSSFSQPYTESAALRSESFNYHVVCASFDVEDDQKIVISEAKHAPLLLRVHSYISRFSSQPAKILTLVFNFSDSPGATLKDWLSFYRTTGVLFVIIKCICFFGWNKGWLVYFHICGHCPKVESVDVNCHRLI